MAQQFPEFEKIKEDLAAFHAKIDNLSARAPDGYWAGSARQHLCNFEAAYRKAFHELPASEKSQVDEGDLF